MGNESPDSSTEERIDRLESVVQQQNETIREMLPGRRAVLAGGAAAALGFAGGAGSASGQSAAGQVGTSSEPVDVEAAGVNAGSVSTGDATVGDDGDGNIGPDERSFYSVGDTVVTVPGDYSTLQEALNSVPYFLRDRYKIEVDAGVYDEDLVIPPHRCMDVSTNSGEEFGILIVEGDVTTPSNVEVNSVTVLGAGRSNSPAFRGFRITGSNPWDNENAAFVLIGGGGNALFIQNEIRGDGTGKGIVAYSGGITVQNSDFGTGERALLMENKHNGHMWVEGTVTGEATERAFSIASNTGISFEGDNTNLSGQNSFVSPNRGYLINYSSGRMYAGEGLPLGGERESVTVDDGSITPERAATFRVSTASTSTAIDTINGDNAINGDRITITNRSDGNSTTIEHLTGNIYLAGGADKTLNSARDTIQLRYNGTNWIQEWFADL